MKVQSISCISCGYTVFSRARHDMRWCTCGAVAIDGGRDYTKVAYTGAMPEVRTLNVPATADILYDDWARGRDEWGLHLTTPLLEFV